ncbi:MAG: hypothetical protein Q9207_005357 [Kuettlingeria erythrocarpa]
MADLYDEGDVFRIRSESFTYTIDKKRLGENAQTVFKKAGDHRARIISLRSQMLEDASRLGRNEMMDQEGVERWRSELDGLVDKMNGWEWELGQVRKCMAYEFARMRR